MSARAVLDRARALDISLTAAPDGSLDVYGQPEAIEALTPLLRAHKADLLALLQAPPPLTAERAVGDDLDVSLAELRAEAGNDWPLLEADPRVLATFALAVSIRRQRDRGERPKHYTQASTCRACGPVWLWEGAPPHVAACPWCSNRAAGIPRPAPPPPSTLLGRDFA